MADERSMPPYLPASGAGKPPSPIPNEYNWQSIMKKDGDDLFDHYRHLLEDLAKESGLLGLIFGRAQNADTRRC
ncbi:MAG: hypothetical protein NUV74_06405 [Candidatus Brocadiaceae bacterium]|nr:hypothetical protein [Candidatus Brocadiaceae bacterium]